MLWLHSLKVAQLLRSAACLHTNQSRSYLNHLVHRSFIVHFFTTDCQYIDRSGCVLEEFFTSHKILFHWITVCPLCFGGGVQDSVVDSNLLLDGHSDPGACEGFSLHIHPDQPWGPPCHLYHVYQVSFVRLKWPGHNNPPLSSTEFENGRVVPL